MLWPPVCREGVPLSPTISRLLRYPPLPGVRMPQPNRCRDHDSFVTVFYGSVANVLGSLTRSRFYRNLPGRLNCGASVLRRRPQRTEGQHHHLPEQWKLDATANAVSATKLATARTIDGVNFDGSAAVSRYGSVQPSQKRRQRLYPLQVIHWFTGASIGG